MDDKVTKPSHYERYPIEPVTFIMENNLDFATGNVVKYLLRAGGKQYDGLSKLDSEVTDLRKAIRYIQMRINLINNVEVTSNE